MADAVDRAVEADVATFRPGSAPPFAVIRARGISRQRRRRRATVVAAVLVPALSAATALAAVTAGGLLRPPVVDPVDDPPTSPPPSVPSPPPWAPGEHAVVLRGRTLAVVAAANVRGPALYTVGGGRVSRKVAAAGDGATFYFTEPGPGCTATIFRLTASGTERVAETDLDVRSLAVSRDGRALAYVGQRPSIDARETAGATRAGAPVPCQGEAVLRVRDLQTGAERSWPRPRGRHGNHDDVNGSIQELAWSPDGRHLAAFDALNDAVFELDTEAASPWRAAALPHPVPPLPESPPGQRCSAALPAYLPGGELTALIGCVPSSRTPHTEWFVRSRVAVYDPATRRTGRTLFAFPTDVIPAWVALDASGTRAYVGGAFDRMLQSIPPSVGREDLAAVSDLFDEAKVVYRWAAGGPLREVVRGDDAPYRVWW